MALRSAVAVGSAVPTGLWAWIDHDTYAYVDFMHATNGSGWKTDPRLAWLYQRLYSKAALHGLVREVIPDDKTFWLTWLACPQLINIKILRKHFTDHSWLNLTYVSQQYAELATMLLRPRQHFSTIPLRAAMLPVVWLVVGFFNLVLPESFNKFLWQLFGWLRVISLPLLAPYQWSGVLRDCAMIAGGVGIGICSLNPLTWEPYLDANRAFFVTGAGGGEG